MDFKGYSNKAWADHATNAETVANGFTDSMKLVTEASEVIPFVNLVVHVMGEHLARFADGKTILKNVSELPFNDESSNAAIERSIAILNYTENQNGDLLSKFQVSDKIRIVATAASALVAHNKTAAAASAFKFAQDLCSGLNDADPANRAMVVAANNLACALEEISLLAPDEKSLMILAAQSARKYWQLAGSWLEVERAEYRLSQSYLKAGDYISSIKHANLCLTICEANSAGPLEFFYAYEAIASVEKAMGQPLRSLPQMQAFFEKLPEGDKSWCEGSLKKFK